MAWTTDDQRRAERAYHDQNLIQKRVALSRIYDTDILRHLETVRNFSGYIKRLIREDMARGTSSNNE